MTGGKLRNWILAGFASLVLAVAVLAWLDGGAEPVRPISEPVALPEMAR